MKKPNERMAAYIEKQHRLGLVSVAVRVPPADRAKVHRRAAALREFAGHATVEKCARVPRVTTDDLVTVKVWVPRDSRADLRRFAEQLRAEAGL